MTANIYNADRLVNRYRSTSVQLEDGRWVTARPVNHKYMSWWGRLAVAWQVFRGKYDALEWTGQ